MHSKSKEILEKAKKLGIEVPTLGQVVDSKFIQALEKRIAMKPMAVGPYSEMMKKYQESNAVSTFLIHFVQFDFFIFKIFHNFKIAKIKTEKSKIMIGSKYSLFLKLISFFVI